MQRKAAFTKVKFLIYFSAYQQKIIFLNGINPLNRNKIIIYLIESVYRSINFKIIRYKFRKICVYIKYQSVVL